MNKEYRIECEECETVSIVLLENGAEPAFCSCCGRRAEVEELEYVDATDEFTEL